jgi:zinc-ribbon domain
MRGFSTHLRVIGTSFTATIMALIKCPECQHQVSDKAVSCPSCGHPIARGASTLDCGAESSSVIPLLTPEGKTCGSYYHGQLFGYCPFCDTKSDFLEPTIGEKIPAVSEELNSKGCGNFTIGALTSLVSGAVKLISGGKIVMTYQCTRCHTNYHVCPHCSKPNRIDVLRDRCDYCSQLVIL